MAGRPRSEQARLAVLEAAADLLYEKGFAGATIEAVAGRAGVSKVTIYKWWPSRGAVAIDAYFHRFRSFDELTGEASLPDTGDVERDLVAHIASMTEAFGGRPGEVMAELIGQAQCDPALAEAIQLRWLAPRRQAAMARLQEAIRAGQIAPGTDLALLLDVLYAPLYYRVMMRHEPIGTDLAAPLVRSVLDGVRT